MTYVRAIEHKIGASQGHRALDLPSKTLCFLPCKLLRQLHHCYGTLSNCHIHSLVSVLMSVTANGFSLQPSACQIILRAVTSDQARLRDHVQDVSIRSFRNETGSPDSSHTSNTPSSSEKIRIETAVSAFCVARSTWMPRAGGCHPRLSMARSRSRQ